MALLVDAVYCLINSEKDAPYETRTLNKELADILATGDEQIIVVTNARGDNYKKIRELLADYKFETYTLENSPMKSEPDFFARLLMYYGLQPEECFYLDHSQDNLDAAAELEIEGELYVDNDHISFLKD